MSLGQLSVFADTEWLHKEMRLSQVFCHLIVSHICALHTEFGQHPEIFVFRGVDWGIFGMQQQSLTVMLFCFKILIGE